MKLLGAAAVAVAAIVSSVVVAVPAGAVEPGQVISGRAGCLEGQGTITLREKQVSADETHVVITGTGLVDGRLKGLYTRDIEADGPPEDIELNVEVVDHEFRQELDVAGDGGGQSMLMLWKGRALTCMVSLAKHPRLDMALDLDAGVATRFRKSGSVEIGGYLYCEDASRWRWRVKAEFGDGWMGFGGHGRVCRDNQVKIPWLELSSKRVGLDRPETVRLVARSTDGDVRRISYRVSTA